MRAWTLAFSLGVIACGFVPRVPAFHWIAGVLLFGILLQGSRAGRLIGACLLGCGWLLWYAHHSVAALWPEPLEGVDVWTRGVVWNLPQQTERSLRFEFRVDSLCTESLLDACEFGAASTHVLINLYQPLPVAPGQRWQLKLRLQRPHGFANPGGFDYEAWLMEHGVRATGYVRESRDNRLLEANTGRRTFTRLRAYLARRIDGVDGLRYPHLIRALTLGDGGGISEDEWTLFRETGTSHLIVISGTHVALIALVLYRLGWWLAARSTWLLLRCPAPQVAAGFALVGAWFYADLAGFSLPVQRAFVMAAMLFAARLLRRQASAIDALCLALALILVLDPLAPQNAGFWLSYCAVAVLLLATTAPRKSEVDVLEAGRSLLRAGWNRLGREWRTQWLVFLGLVPALLLFFQQVSPLSPLVNMPAIPYIGILVVPLALVAVLLLWVWPAPAQALLKIVDLLLHGYMRMLDTYVALTPFDLVTVPSLTAPAMALLCLLVSFVLFARIRRWRYIAALLLPLPFFWPQAQPGEGEVKVAVLDVGQGLAVVVSTRRHHLLYDTGPYFSSRFDAGSDVVVPYLRQRNIRRLDVVIVSHADGDHAGGLAGVAAEFPGARYLGSAPGQFPIAGERCTAGQAWTWDGVEFALLHPASAAYEGNDSSCVLLVRSGGSTILLPGDIERGAENRLLRSGVLPEITLLLAPHHGSNSSSTAAFVSITRPRAVVYSSGYRNRFRHPRPEVRERYAAAGSAEYLTSRSGAVEFTLGPSGIAAVGERRRTHRRFWAYPL